MTEDGNISGNEIQNATLHYLGVSENAQIRQVLKFFSNYPRVIEIEASRMGNPYYIIKCLAEFENGDLSKKRELKRFRDRVIVGILFWTGMRVGELVRVQKKDFDLIGKTLNVPTLKQRKKVRRPIPLSHVPNSELKLWDKYMNLMGIGEEDRVVKLSDREVERIVAKMLEMNPHALRHALGLFLYEFTKDIRLVSQVLRHTNIANTMIYTRLSLDGMREKLELR